MLKANFDESGKIHLSFRLKNSKENKGELYDRCDCICFCDIPNDSLRIHRKEYSSFGLGFKKLFLITQGARPVTYVPKSCKIRDVLKGGPSKESEACFSTLGIDAYSALSMLLTIDKVKPLNKQLSEILPRTKGSFKDSVQNML